MQRDYTRLLLVGSILLNIIILIILVSVPVSKSSVRAYTNGLLRSVSSALTTVNATKSDLLQANAVLTKQVDQLQAMSGNFSTVQNAYALVQSQYYTTNQRFNQVASDAANALQMAQAFSDVAGKVVDESQFTQLRNQIIQEGNTITALQQLVQTLQSQVNTLLGATGNTTG